VIWLNSEADIHRNRSGLKTEHIMNLRTLRQTRLNYCKHLYSTIIIIILIILIIIIIITTTTTTIIMIIIPKINMTIS